MSAWIILLIAGSFFIGYSAGWGDYKNYKEVKETYELIEDWYDFPTYRTDMAKLIDKE